MATGITKRRSRKCRSRDGGSCNCRAEPRGMGLSPRDRKKIRAPHSFARESEARAWRAEALAALGRGTLRATTPRTLEEAWGEWVRGRQEEGMVGPVGESATSRRR